MMESQSGMTGEQEIQDRYRSQRGDLSGAALENLGVL
jgi:hypothetical protein